MIFLLAFAALLSTALGGLIALRNKNHLHIIFGFAAGIMLGLVAFDLLPKAFELSSVEINHIPMIMVCFLIGFMILHFIERAVAMHNLHENEYGSHTHPHVGLMSAIALSVHSLLDGVSIGLAFQINDTTGWLVALAVLVHDFSDGLNTVTLMKVHGNNNRRTLIMLGVDAIAPIIGAASTLLFTLPQEYLGWYLAGFAGLLLYLAVADILPEAHARRPSRLTLLATLTGIGVMWFTISAVH